MWFSPMTVHLLDGGATSVSLRFIQDWIKTNAAFLETSAFQCFLADRSLLLL